MITPQFLPGYSSANRSAGTNSVAVAGAWNFVGQNQQNTWYSAQNLVNLSNVGNLKPLWFAPLPVTYGTPLISNGIVYVVAGAYPSPATIEALDESTGALIWSAGPTGQPSLSFSTNGGVTVDSGNLFAATLDGKLVSLNALTGAGNWEVSNRQGVVGNVGAYEGAQGTPLVYNNEIILGEAGSDKGARGFLTAFSEADGTLLWTFYTVPPDPITATNQGPYGNSWSVCPNCSGGDVWNVPAVDAQTGIIYFQTGNPYPVADSSTRSSNPAYTNLYTDSIIALNALTGQIVWYYQRVPADVHDWDAGMPVQLFNITINGVQTEVVGAGGKDGYYYVLNAANGSLIYKVKVGIHFNEAASPTPQGVIVYPGGAGGEQSGINSYSSYNPQTNMVYTMAYNEPANYSLSSTGPKFSPVKGVAHNCTLYAIDASTGSVAWSLNFTGFGGGVSSTNGIVFTSTGNKTYYALNALSAAVLWKYTVSPGSLEFWNWGPPSIVDGKVFETVGGPIGGVLAFTTQNTNFSPQLFSGPTLDGGPTKIPVGQTGSWTFHYTITANVPLSVATVGGALSSLTIQNICVDLNPVKSPPTGSNCSGPVSSNRTVTLAGTSVTVTFKSTSIATAWTIRGMHGGTNHVIYVQLTGKFNKTGILYLTNPFSATCSSIIGRTKTPPSAGLTIAVTT